MPHSSFQCPAEIRIGTRGSALAVAQAEEVKRRILNAFPEQLDANRIHIKKIMTTGDRIQDKSLTEIGGKGLFTKEIEEALFAGTVDIAVHSMKDMTDVLPDGLTINCILEREDPRDAFISPIAKTIADLPSGAVVGTSSVRRQAQLLTLRPDVKVVPFRGNVQTRLRKLTEGQVDATFLAVAGLRRVGQGDEITSIIDTDAMLPAVAQGAIGIESLTDNIHIHRVLQAINHAQSQVRVEAERAFLKALGGSCSTPIAGLAEFDCDGGIFFRGLVASPDGQELHRRECSGSAETIVSRAREVGEALFKQAGHLLG